MKNTINAFVSGGAAFVAGEVVETAFAGSWLAGIIGAGLAAVLVYFLADTAQSHLAAEPTA